MLFTKTTNWHWRAKDRSVMECSELPECLLGAMVHTQNALRFLVRLAAAGTGLSQVRVRSIGNRWGRTRELADLYNAARWTLPLPRRRANRAAHSLIPPLRLMKSRSGSSKSLTKNP